ncbi:MAG: adenine deaminase [Clostridia bacterium]
MRIQPRDRDALVEAALGKRPADLLIENVQLVNVFTGEIYPASVLVYEGFVAHVEADPDGLGGEIHPMEAKERIDGGGSYLLPGLIDSHVHIESSMMTPANFARTVLPHGTTTAITDPHEIGNVLGIEGVRYMLEASEGLPMRQYVLTPSCVPSVPGLETTGASFGAEEIAEMLQWDRVLGLAEVMDYPGVIHGSQRMRDILAEAQERNTFIQGHSPTLSGRALSAYLCAGPTSDHEVRVTSEAREKMRLGMTIDGRESSISRNLEDVIPALEGFDLPPNFTLCTDDREPADLIADGSVNHVVRRAIEEGVEPVRAIRYATLHPARSVGIENLGAVAPGYVADMVLVPDLEAMVAKRVFFEGREVARNGQTIVEFPDADFSIERHNTVHLAPLEPRDLQIEAPGGSTSAKVRVITYASEDSLFAEFAEEDVPVTEGYLAPTEGGNLATVAVFHRHGANDNRALGIIRRFGLTHGAVAATVSHDCHNLTVVATNPEDGARAANVLIEHGGGLACVRGGEVLDVLPLPIAGLMSDATPEQMARSTERLKDTLRGMGIPGEDPLLRIATLTLAVIPEAKITDMGLVSVNDQELVPLFCE